MQDAGVRGGQGRTGEQVAEDAAAITLAAVGFVLTVILWVLA